MRSDADLRRDVKRELDWDVSVDSRRLVVSVEGGIVTLRGEVSTYAQKWNAERAAERVSGVRGVADEIVIQRSMKRPDREIAKAAADVIRWNSTLPDDRVLVEVEDGWVTLTGELANDYERRAAEVSVRYLLGVRGITNLISISPSSEAVELEQRIEESFERQAALDAKAITIAVDHGHVLLEGVVHSWAERRAAERTAWDGPGVRSVTNHLTVNAF